jgi:hypothetical protein
VTLDDHRTVPEWEQMARRQEDDERAARYEELLVRDSCESVEATERMWSGIFAGMASDPLRAMPDEDRPGLDRRCFAVDGDVDRPDTDPISLPWRDVG